MPDHRTQRTLLRTELHDLAHACGLEIVEIPAERLVCGVAHQDLPKLPAAFLFGQDLAEPFHGRLVVLRPECAAARGVGQTREKFRFAQLARRCDWPRGTQRRWRQPGEETVR